MSEKRFKMGESGIQGEMVFIDTQSNKIYWQEYFDEIVDLVNEQQATIKSKDKQLERLYNYFQDYLKDEMSGNAFSEMWDFVKEDERWG